ncbi:hypothetical protein QTP88_003289 [Uroleucon formosanum]
MTIIIRFVSIEDLKVTIREHFLGFISVESTTEENLSDVLLNTLRELNIRLSNMRGQGYDNGADMKGVHSGVQRHIRNINPRAFFVPCSAHSLNFVINDAAKSSKEAAAFFDITQKVFNFFSASTIRWQILLKYVKELALKPLNPMVKYEAECLCNLIKTFKFICSVVIWYNILNLINPISKLMQKPNFDISLALSILKTLLKHLNELRSEESSEKMIVDSTALAMEMGVESVFENSRAINSVNDRFEQLKEHNNNFSFLYNLKKLKNLIHEELLNHCKDLQILLNDGDSTDINGIEIAHELKSVSAMVDDNLTPYELLTFVINAVATGERSFSKLKLIKTYLRSTMKSERLCGLAVISIEHEVGQQLTEKELVDDFAKLKARKHL